MCGWARGKRWFMFTRNCQGNRLRVSGKVLHASDGRDTEALNCKPITNL